MPRTPIHPGEHLAEELRELGLSAAELSRQIDVPVNRITGIIHGQRGITADTALRLGHWFGTSPQFWMNLQQNYELRLAENQVGAKIAVLPRRATRPTSRKIGKTKERPGGPDEAVYRHPNDVQSNGDTASVVSSIKGISKIRAFDKSSIASVKNYHEKV